MKIKEKLKRTLCILLSSLMMVVSPVSSAFTNVQEVEAAEVLPFIISAGETFASLLAIFGITAGAGYVIDNRDALENWGNEQVNKFTEWVKVNSDKVNTWGATTSTEIESSINQWITDAQNGIIHTSSAVWDSLKAWGGSVYDTLNQSTPELTWGKGVSLPVLGSYTAGYNDTSSRVRYASSSQVFFSMTIDSNKSKTYVTFYSLQGTATVQRYDSDSVGDFSATSTEKLNYSLSIDGQTIYYQMIGLQTTSLTPVGTTYFYQTYSTDQSFIQGLINGMSISVPDDEYQSVGGVSDIFNRDGSLDNIGIAVPGTKVGANDIPIDWGLWEDIVGTLNDVRSGTADIADVLEDIKVFPIDTTRDTVIDSDGDLTNDVPISDVLDNLTSGWSTLWEWLQKLLDGILSIPSLIVELIGELLKSLFIPREAVVTEYVDALRARFAFADGIITAFTDVKNSLANPDDSLKLYTDFNAFESKKYNFGGLVCCLDFAFYKPYKPYGDAIVGAFLWLFCLWRIFKRLPEIISGSGISTDTANPPLPPSDDSQKRIGMK